MVQTAE